ncbi:hypothetical protein HNP84_008340 [Thermocatellispora tengchongensis]|uniref:Secreted protein n=2 Tax=Thermocatellispora tengchongensis TaxID=1073253 RepID=A0A840PIB6_9ACTN|nr:hypothetical protein [Thermocatellispora tengchongensis]MBB5138586.1 hypothetical protein [Thermocatellispora tengchongensis]
MRARRTWRLLAAATAAAVPLAAVLFTGPAQAATWKTVSVHSSWASCNASGQSISHAPYPIPWRCRQVAGGIALEVYV